MAQRIKMDYKDGHSFIFATDGGVWYQKGADVLWEANWGGNWTNQLGYQTGGSNYALSYSKDDGSFQIHKMEASGGSITQTGKGTPGFDSLRLAYCGDMCFLMQTGPSVEAVRLSDKYEVVGSAASGDPGAMLQQYLNSGQARPASGGGGGGGGGAAAGGKRPGGAIRFPADYAFAYTSEQKVTWSKGGTPLWEAQWDGDFTHHQAFIFDVTSCVFSYKQGNNTAVLWTLSDQGAKEAFRTSWEGNWQSFKPNNNQGMHYLVASKPGKHEIASLGLDGLKLVYSTSAGEDPDAIFTAFVKTLVVGEKVANLKYDNDYYFTYTLSRKVTYNSPDARLWAQDWEGQPWTNYLGFSCEDKNYLLTTDDARKMAIQELTNQGTQPVCSQEWEYDFVTYCLSHFANKRYLIAGKSDGHCIIHLHSSGYEIVYTTREMDGRLAFEEYVRTLVGGDAQLNFSKSASAYSSMEYLRYPNGYVFAYLPEKPGEVSYDSPDTGRLWKLNWDDDYTHHVGYVFFGKNYVCSYKKDNGAYDLRLLTDLEAKQTGNGVFDPNWEKLRVAYFDDQGYLIAEAPNKQAIYQLSPNALTLVHAGDGVGSKPAEALIKDVAAKKKRVKTPNGFMVDFDEDKASLNGPEGHLCDAPFDGNAWPEHTGLAANAVPYVLSQKPNSPAFRIDEVTPSGLKPVIAGDLPADNLTSLTPVYFNDEAYLVGNAPDKAVIMKFDGNTLTPVSQGPAGDADKVFENFAQSTLPSPTLPFTFTTDRNDKNPDGDNVPEAHLCYPQNFSLNVSPDGNATYKDNKIPKSLFTDPLDQDVTHNVGFIGNGKPHALSFKHGQGATEIKELTPTAAKPTAKTHIDPEWLSLGVVHDRDKAFLIANKPQKRSVYLLTPEGVKEIPAGTTTGPNCADKPISEMLPALHLALGDVGVSPLSSQTTNLNTPSPSVSLHMPPPLSSSEESVSLSMPAPSSAGAGGPGAGAGAGPGAGAGASAGPGAGGSGAGGPGSGHLGSNPASVIPIGANGPASSAGQGQGLGLGGGANLGAGSTAIALNGSHSALTCTWNVYFPSGHFLAFPCHAKGRVFYSKQLWEAPWSQGFSHCTTFTFEGANYLLSYSKDSGKWTINCVSDSGVTETASGQWELGWTSFSVSYHSGKVVLVSGKADKQDVGVLTSKGYTLLQSRAGFDDFVAKAVSGK